MLKKEGFLLHHEEKTTNCLQQLKEKEYRVCLLNCGDASMGSRPAELIGRLRLQFPDLIVVAISAKGSLAYRVELLEAGAHALVTLPYYVPEVVAQIRSLARGAEAELPELVQAGPLSVPSLELLMRIGGHEVALTAMEHRLMLHLARHAGRMVSRRDLLQQVWSEAHDRDHSNVIEVHVARLRKKLGNYKDQLVTIRSQGYAWYATAEAAAQHQPVRLLRPAQSR